MGTTRVDGGTKIILVIDPDIEVCRLLRFILEEEGYKVTTAQSVEEAIQHRSEPRFDLIITEAFEQTDPFDFNGSFLDRLRPLSKNTPVILFSSYASPSIVSAGSFGLAGVLQKPLGIDELAKQVKRVLTETRRSQSRASSN